MATPPRILPIACPFGAGGTVYVYYVDAPRPALIDTGVAASPLGVIEPALRAAGLRLSDVRWILATHGHWDHVGGMHAARQAVGGEATTAIHGADGPLLGDRRSHLAGYLGERFRYLDDPAALAQTEALVLENISGELAADRALTEGDRVDLGGGVALRVVHTPGHSHGSVSYVLDGPGWAFAGDAVQVWGSSGSRFPLFVDPAAYRASIRRLLEDVRPSRLFLGHQFLDPSGAALDAQLEGGAVPAALRASLEMEARLASAAARVGAARRDAADFQAAAAFLGYADLPPSAWPQHLFTTLGSYPRPADAD